MLRTPRTMRERAREIGFVGKRPPQAFVERREPADGRRVRDN
jgi:hypothetical protein